MTTFRGRQHRLEIPPAPSSDDPAVQKKYSNDLRRLVMDEFNRLASDFYDFKRDTYNAGVIPLRGVSTIAVVPTEYSVSATWELPDGQVVEPTHVRIRILEITPNSWAEYTYPKTSWSFSGLTPGTQYTLQVQLVARFEATETFVSTTRNCPSVPVLRTALSDVKAKVFVTPAGVSPPIDAGTNNDRVNFNFPVTPGIPGAVNSIDCWWRYGFQVSTACVWSDIGTTTDIAGNPSVVNIATAGAPFSSHTNGIFRLKYVEVCNSVQGTFRFGEPFMAVNFSIADCRGIVKSASLSAVPYDTADLFAIPGACQTTGQNMRITNELTDLRLTPMEPGFRCIQYLSDEWTIIADNTTNPAISNTIYTGLLQGNIAGITALGNNSDFTLSFDIKIASNALLLAGGTGAYPIINIGNKIKANIILGLSNYSVTVTVPRDGGGQYTFRADGLPYTLWQDIYYSHDVSEPDGRKLYVNGILNDMSANAIANDFDGIDDTFQISTVNSMEIRRVYGWGKLVVPIVAPVAMGMMAGAASPNVIQLYDLPTNTRSTASAVLSTFRVLMAALSNVGISAWLIGGRITGVDQNIVDRYSWTVSTISVSTARPRVSFGGNAADNPGSNGYQMGDESGAGNGDGGPVYKFMYFTEVWSDTGQRLQLANFRIGVATNRLSAAYTMGFNGSINTYQKFLFSTETLSLLQGGMKAFSRLRPTGMSHQGVSMYFGGGNFSTILYKLAYATETGSATTFNNFYPVVSLFVPDSIGDSPTRGITVLADGSPSQLAYATDTYTSINGFFGATGGACCSGV